MGIGDPTTNHWNNWPNSAGFDVREQVQTPVFLPMTGTIPAYAAGVLYRNGLGPRDVHADKDGRRVYRVSHWFDNLSQVHRFEIHPPSATNPNVTVSHNSRLTCDKVVERIKREARRTEFTFGPDRDPCQTLFQKAQCFFRPQPKDSPSSLCIGVAFAPNLPGLDAKAKRSEKGVDSKLTTLFNLSDHDMMQSLDPRTLEPLGVAEQRVLHPALKGQLSGAHAATDPETGDFFNYNLYLGEQPHGGTYRLFVVSAKTGKTDVLAKFNHTPAYIHSMFLTEHFVVLCVWNSFFRSFGAAILWNRNLINAMQYNRSKPATWLVVDRTPARRGVVATFETPPFFCFHTINAFEEASASSASDTVDLVADLSAYDSTEILTRFYIDNLLSDSPAAEKFGADLSTRPVYRRYRLPGVSLSGPKTTGKPPKPLKGEEVFSGPKGYAPELQTINTARAKRDYQFVYGVTDSGQSTFLDGLVKWDVRNRTYTTWSEPGQTTSEPIFVPDPERSDKEDGGCLLSVVLDGTEGKSYLLVLDAETMKEMGRATVDGVVGFGFHGIHVPQKMLE
ncbi:Dioxygenase [Mycena sanguinolenta]|uniref:Dioxygenase n=1 Tax=Mycena sanguinolenta TaxID=230812 RepID=A0A8H7CQI0_9AGAR|nr:Dioxygenase [Mycena sanguinolenta]